MGLGLRLQAFGWVKGCQHRIADFSALSRGAEAALLGREVVNTIIYMAIDSPFVQRKSLLTPSHQTPPNPTPKPSTT